MLCFAHHQVCEDYGSIERVNKISHDSMTEEYLFYSIPVIVTDAAQDWRATQEFNIDFIKQVRIVWVMEYFVSVLSNPCMLLQAPQHGYLILFVA